MSHVRPEIYKPGGDLLQSLQEPAAWYRMVRQPNNGPDINQNWRANEYKPLVLIEMASLLGELTSGTLSITGYPSHTRYINTQGEFTDIIQYSIWNEHPKNPVRCVSVEVRTFLENEQYDPVLEVVYPLSNDDFLASDPNIHGRDGWTPYSYLFPFDSITELARAHTADPRSLGVAAIQGEGDRYSQPKLVEGLHDR
jgi:hypothetical protein